MLQQSPSDEKLDRFEKENPHLFYNPDKADESDEEWEELKKTKPEPVKEFKEKKAVPQKKVTQENTKQPAISKYKLFPSPQDKAPKMSQKKHAELNAKIEPKSPRRNAFFERGELEYHIQAEKDRVNEERQGYKYNMSS